MKFSFHRACTIVAASALVLCLGAACSGQGAAGGASGESASAANSASAVANSASANGVSADNPSSTSADSTGSVGASGSASNASPSADASAASPSATSSLSQLEANALPYFQGVENGAKLAADMAAGNVPTECNVLYDQMGARPSVTVTDPDTIAEIYDLMSAVQVLGESNMSITDSYHHVIFTLQDGTKVGYGFEGEGNLVLGKTSYSVAGDGPLWSYVRQLQEGSSASTPRYAINATGATGDDLVSKLPKNAAAGDTVAFISTIMTDAYVEVYLDGNKLEPVPGVVYLYAFTMPNHDVTVEAREVGEIGGA